MTAKENIAPRKPRRRRWLVWLSRFVLMVVVLVTLVVAALQTPWGANRVKSLVEDAAANALVGARLEIGSLGGSLLFGASARDVKLYARDSLITSVEAVEADYNLLALIVGKIRLGNVRLSKPQIRARQLPDSTWDVLSILPESDPQAPPSEPIDLAAEKITVADGMARTSFVDSDSVIALTGIDVTVSGVSLAEHLSVDQVVADLQADAGALPEPLAIHVNLSYGQDRFVCTECTLRSSRSNLSVDGFLELELDSGARGADLTVVADSLRFSDLNPFLPWLPEEQFLTGTATVFGPADSLAVDLAFESASGSGEVHGVMIDRDSVAYGLTARFFDIDPAGFWQDSPAYGEVTGSVDVDLSGSSIDSASGVARIQLLDTILNDRQVSRSDVTIDFDDGLATVDAAVSLPALELDMQGTAHPFADTIDYQVTGHVDARGLGDRYEELQGLDRVALDYRLVGSTAEAADRARYLHLEIDEITYSDIRIDSAVVQARRIEDQVEVSVSAGASSASTEASIGRVSGEAILSFGDEIEVFVPEVDVVGFDVGLGNADGRVSNLTGQLNGVASIPAEIRLMTATASGTVWGHLMDTPLDSVEVDARLADEILTFDAVVEALGSSVALNGEADVWSVGIPLEASGRYIDVDVAEVLSDTTMRSKLNGTFDLSSTWVSKSDHLVAVVSEVGPSLWNDQQVTGGTIEFMSRNGAVTLDLRLDTPLGMFDVEGDVAGVFDGPVSVSAKSRFSRINVGSILGVERLSTDLSGEVEIEGNGTQLDLMVDLAPSVVNRAEITGGSVKAQRRGDEYSLDANVAVGKGRVTLTGGLRNRGVDSDLQAVFAADSVDVAAVAGLEAVASLVHMGCSVTGTWSEEENVDLAGICLARRSRIGTVRIDSLRAQARLTSAEFSLDTLVASTNVVDIDAHGSVVLKGASGRSDLSAQARIWDLSYLESVLPVEVFEGEGTIDVGIGGSPGEPEILVEPRLEYLTYNDIRISSINGYALVSDPGLEIPAVEAVIDVGYSTFAGFPVQATSMSLLADSESVIFVSDVHLDGRRRGTLAASFYPQLDNPELRIEDLTLNLQGTIWRLSQDAVVSGGDTWNVRNLLISDGSAGQIAVDGQLDLDGEQNLILTAEQVEAAAFIDLFGVDDVEGLMEGYVILGGTADSLLAEANFRVRDLASREALVGDIQLQLEFADRRLAIDSELRHLGGGRTWLEGSIPIVLSLDGSGTLDEDDAVTLEMSADSLPIAWTLPFLDHTVVDDIAGVLNGQISLTGAYNEPILSGSGTVTNGMVRLPAFNIQPDGIEADFSLQGDVLTLSSFTARTGTGTISGTGTVDFETLTDLGLDLDVEFENFRAIHTSTYRFTLTGTAIVQGSMRAPVVDANVLLGPGDVHMTEELLEEEIEPITLNERDLRILERRFGYRVVTADTTTSTFYQTLTLNATIEIGRDVWLRSTSNPAMDIEFFGSLSVEKEPFKDQNLFGTINVNPQRSRIIQFARRFTLERGTVTFNGLLEHSVVDFQADYVVPSRFGGDEVKIMLAVTGLLDDLELDVTSQPQMDDATIASYLVTGRPPGEALTGEQAAEIAVSGVSRVVEAFANENFGLDVVEIETSGTRGTRLTVGKYISPRVFVSVTQPLTSGSDSERNGSRTTELGIEYELFSWLITEIASREGSFWGNLHWRLAF